MDAAHLYLSEPIPGLTAVPHQLKGLNKAQKAALWALCTEFRKCYENTLYVYTIAYLTPKTKTLAPNQHLSCAVLLYHTQNSHCTPPLPPTGVKSIKKTSKYRSTFARLLVGCARIQLVVNSSRLPVMADPSTRRETEHRFSHSMLGYLAICTTPHIRKRHTIFGNDKEDRENFQTLGQNLYLVTS